MTHTDLLTDSFGRIRDLVHGVTDGLTPDELSFRPDSQANPIAWLVWHLTRVQDDHVADIAGSEQVWTSAGWAGRFALPLDISDTGYGHGPSQVAVVSADSELLCGYHDAVHEATVRFVQRVTEADLDRVVDERFDPPVTMAVRLVSVVCDDLQHAGQAAYVRGILERR
ncbi:MAG TPA: DUF664 domain-containing protein [Acidimicrobiales bacterium]|nr:DUF664 domain-containing protein [Acidimicrobiales bacterium]